ncbi:MAG: hypothetical protein IKA19_02620 [Muribaculaceae bacterium]|nr:hypothetical protein [Muribaculaceae bacterium]
MKKLLLSICVILALCLSGNSQESFATNTKKASVSAELLAQNNRYQYLGSITAYFINQYGQWQKNTTLNFGLYSDAYGNKVIGCSNRYGTSFHNIVSSDYRDFRFAFYCHGWYYFN